MPDPGDPPPGAGGIRSRRVRHLADQLPVAEAEPEDGVVDLVVRTKCSAHRVLGQRRPLLLHALGEQRVALGELLAQARLGVADLRASSYTSPV